MAQRPTPQEIKAVARSATSNSHVTAVLADSHDLVRAGLRVLFGMSGRIKIVGEAVDGHNAVALAQQHQPTVLLAEVNLQRLHVFDVLSRLAGSDTRVLIVSSAVDEMTIAECLRLGARGYVLKNSSFQELEYGIEEVRKGEVYLCGEATRIMMKATKDVLLQLDSAVGLTKRELIVLQLAAKGMTSAQISTALFISRRTAEAHRANGMKKLGIHNQTELVRYGIKKNWIAP